MATAYYNKPTSAIEKVLPISITGITVGFIFWANLTEYPSLPIFLIVVPVSLLTIAFLFPPILYRLNIDIGNSKNFLLWVLPLILLAFGFQNKLADNPFQNFLKFPLVLFGYAHATRLLYVLLNKNLPAIGATWFRKGDRDKFANRKITDTDIIYNILYTVTPLIGFIIYLWCREVLMK